MADIWTCYVNVQPRRGMGFVTPDLGIFVCCGGSPGMFSQTPFSFLLLSTTPLFWLWLGRWPAGPHSVVDRDCVVHHTSALGMPEGPTWLLSTTV
jgi:hypothetical protein